MEEVTLSSIQNKKWDVVIVGAGVAGSTAALALGQADLKVLVVEKGLDSKKSFQSRGRFAEQSRQITSLKNESKIMQHWGRSGDIWWDGKKAYMPFIGNGLGGSSSLYGMAMEPFDELDFKPQQKHPASKLPLPEWPIDIESLKSHYKVAQRIYGVKGEGELPLAPPYSDANEELKNYLQKKSLNPYKISMACSYVKNCLECQGFLCSKSCKNDSYTSCLRPAQEMYGVEVITDCEVTKIEKVGDRVTELKAVIGTLEVSIKSDLFILAAGAIATPILLQKSKNLANSSNQVGKNLMRHLIDLYAVKTKAVVQPGDLLKQLALRDFTQETLPLAYVHSFGRFPPANVIRKELLSTSPIFATPFLRVLFPMIHKLFLKKMYQQPILATILEDMPSSENRVQLFGDKVVINYQMSEYDKYRVSKTRSRMKETFKDYALTLIKDAGNNKRIAHACGTCRMGEEPRTSVVNPSNQTHDLKNLYVLDSSFFPTSSSFNPSLTLAANSFRVCAEISKREFNFEETVTSAHAL